MARVLAQLSRSSKSFVAISNDNRIHVWDTDSRKEKRSYVEKNHLLHSYTCFHIHGQTKTALGTLAVGCSDGVVILWDLTRGVVTKTIGSTDGPAVTGVAFSSDGQTLYVSTTDSHILCYSTGDGELKKSIKTGKKGVLEIALNPQVDVLAVAGTSIKLVDIESGRKRKLEATFSGGVNSIAFSQCGCYLVASSGQTREVLLFDVQATAESSAPLVAIPVTGIPAQLVLQSVVSEEDGSTTLNLFVSYDVADGAVVRLVHHGSREDVEASITSCAVRTGAAIHAAIFGKVGHIQGSVCDSVSLATGSLSAPFFAHMPTNTADGALKQQLDVSVPGVSSAEASRVSEPASHKEVAVNGAPVVLGPLEAGGTKRPLVGEEVVPAAAAGADDDKKKKKAKVSADDSEALQLSPDELTLEQRLESLSASITEMDARSKRGPGAAFAASGVVVTGESLTTLVEQALQSGDDSLLEECFACEDVTVIDATVSRLPASRIIPLLKKLVAKFERRPSRSTLLTHWLASLLRQHTAFLMAVPDLSVQLAGLSQILEQRLSSYTKLSALGGRLDLMMQQVTFVGAQGAAKAGPGSSGVPKAVFREA